MTSRERLFFNKYKKFVQDKWKDNIKDIFNGSYDSQKIDTHADNMGIDHVEFINAINNKNIFAGYILAIDPTRQSNQEKFQATYVNNKVGYNAIEVLKKKNEYYYVWNGLKTKTADAIITDKNGEKFICSMKLIQQSGGAQDNQRKDLQLFLAAASEKSDMKVIGLIDDTDHKSSEFYLNGVKDRNKAFLFNSDELVDFLKYKESE